MTSGDILHALDDSLDMARQNFPSIASDKGEDYAHGVLHGLSSLRIWLRSREFEQHLEREACRKDKPHLAKNCVHATTETTTNDH